MMIMMVIVDIMMIMVAISQVAREWARPWWSFSYSLAWHGLLSASSGYLGWAEFRFVLLVKFSAKLEPQPMHCTMTQASWNNLLGLDLDAHLWSWKSIWDICLENNSQIFFCEKCGKSFIYRHTTQRTQPAGATAQPIWWARLLRYESSNPTSQELSSSIFQSLSLCRLSGTDGHTKTDEFSEKFHTAFDPPPSFSENHFAIFDLKNLVGQLSTPLHHQTFLSISVCLRLPDYPQLPDGHLDLFQDMRHSLLGSHLRWRLNIHLRLREKSGLTWLVG